MADPLGLAPAAATTDWSKASYEDKFVEIVKRAAPMVPGEIGAALQEMVQPGNLADMGVVFTAWAVAQGTPAGWVADLAILGLSYYALGSGVVDLFQAVMALHNGAATAKCDPDLTAAARIVANKLVAAAGGIGGGAAGVIAVPKSGGITRIANGVQDIIAYARKRTSAGANGADNVINGVKLNNQFTSQAITNGHAFEKHIGEFSDLGIITKAQFQQLIENVMNNASNRGPLKNGRSYFYEEKSNTIVIKDPNSADAGTAFRIDTTRYPDPLEYIKTLR